MHPSVITPCPSAPGRPGARGFTAIELMVTIAIAAILVSLAAPSFTGLMERWRVRQATEGLQHTLYYARAEAIKRGGNVVIQKLPNNTNGCTTASAGTSWDCGWFVCEDTNGNGSCASTEPVLQRFDAPTKLEITRTSGAATIQLDRWGMVAGTWVGFSFVPRDKAISDPAAQAVCMSSGGRVRVISDPPCSSG